MEALLIAVYIYDAHKVEGYNIECWIIKDISVLREQNMFGVYTIVWDC